MEARSFHGELTDAPAVEARGFPGESIGSLHLLHQELRACRHPLEKVESEVAVLVGRQEARRARLNIRPIPHQAHHVQFGGGPND